MAQDKILVLDFGGQYTQLIAKAVRKCNVFSEIVDCETSLDKIVEANPRGLILSGGPDSVYQPKAPTVDPKLFDLGIPILGICYGMQLTNYTLLRRSRFNRWLLNHILGDGILHGKNAIKEYGETTVNVDNSRTLFTGLDDKIIAWMSHGDSVDGTRLAKGLNVIARTENHVAAVANSIDKIYGVQFHPEVTHTPKGLDVISNFVHYICRCGNKWTMANYIEECKDYIRKTVGKNDVVSFVSGGVDSSFVTAVLAQTEGIGRVIPVYIGALMRKNENEEVLRSLEKAGVKDLRFYECEDRFIKAVEGMSDPEQKRKAIGNLFGKIMQEVCDELHLNPETTFLAQGTLYTDLIESGKGVGKNAATIKSHHNVGCKFIDDLKKVGRVVEPNRLIFKDEVRVAAREIGLPEEISERQPYPGPGLGIRIIDGNPGWINDEFYRISDRVKSIASDFGLEGLILPVKTVGVQGDERSYSFTALLRGRRDFDKIREAAVAIPKEVHEVNRIVYDTNTVPIPLSYTDKAIPTLVTRETIDLLKDVDFEGRQIIDRYGFSKNISQTIFVLFGADIYNTGKRSVALRAVSTDDFMTVSPVAPDNIRMSWQCLDELHNNLLRKYNIGAFVIDVTDKPPATTCWE